MYYLKMNAFHFASAVLIIAVVNLRTIHSYTCKNVYEDSGVVSTYQEVLPRNSFSTCWEFSVKEDEAVNVRIKEFSVRIESTYRGTEGYLNSRNPMAQWYRTSTSNPEYERTHVRIATYDSKERDIYFRPNTNNSDQWISIHSDFNVSLHVPYNYEWYCKTIVEFSLEYEKTTGIKSIKGVKEVSEKAKMWMKNKLQLPFKWQLDIERMVIALQLSDGVNFSRVDFMEELLIKQLDLKTSVALLKNNSDPLSINKLAIVINALLATCHNPRQFYGYNLVELLKQEMKKASTTSPAAFLALCNANEALSPNATQNLLNILSSNSKYLFLQDIEAITVMALSCMKRQNNFADNETDLAYRDAIEQLLNEQLSDGSFGNVYSTAVITQALMSSEVMNKTDKRIFSAIKFLVKKLNSSSPIDFLSAYYTLPILNGKTLLDIGQIDCSKYPKRERDGGIEIDNKLGKKIMVQYSLYVGEKKDVIHTIFLRVSEGTSAYEVMKYASTVDPKYSFEFKMKSQKIYIYRIAGINNDPEEGLYWLMYYKEKNSTNLEHTTESPDKVHLSEGSHLILWYKNVELF